MTCSCYEPGEDRFLSEMIFPNQEGVISKRMMNTGIAALFVAAGLLLANAASAQSMWPASRGDDAERPLGKKGLSSSEDRPLTA